MAERALSEMSEGEQDRTLLKVAQTLARLVAAEAESSRAMTGERASDEVMPSGESAAEDPLTAYRQSLLHDLSRRYQVDTRFVRLRLLDMMRSEHALQFREQAKDFTDLGEVLAAIPERAMVLLGAPGCGKSTLLRRLQLDDARDRLADHGEQVSLFVSLGAYPLDKDPARDAPRPLDWLKAQWRRQAPNLPDIEALLGQRRVLLLLDALNEMPHRDADDFRQRVEKWRCFLRDDFPPGNRAVFSCRSLDYSETLSVKDTSTCGRCACSPLLRPRSRSSCAFMPSPMPTAPGPRSVTTSACSSLQHALLCEASDRPARLRPARGQRALGPLHRICAACAGARDRRAQFAVRAGWRARGERPRANRAARLGARL